MFRLQLYAQDHPLSHIHNVRAFEIHDNRSKGFDKNRVLLLQLFLFFALTIMPFLGTVVSVSRLYNYASIHLP